MTEHWQQEIIHLTSTDIAGNNEEDFKKNLAAFLNKLINQDFEKLVMILYRLDVNEKKIKDLLAEKNDTDAGLVIAQAIIDRQKQKIEARKKYTPPEHNIPDDEKW